MNSSGTTRDAWDKIAKGYDRTNTPTQMWMGNEGLRRAGVRSGMKVLDVAAGSGALSIPAARLGAQVLATDKGLFTLNACPRDSGKARHRGAKRSRGGSHGEHLQRGGRAFPEITRRAGYWQAARRRCELVVCQRHTASPAPSPAACQCPAWARI